MYLCSSPAEGLRNLEQLVVVVMQRRMNPEQFDKRLSSHVASVRLQLLIDGEQSKSSLHQPIGLSHIQELERNKLQGCLESSCSFSDDW
jgi:dTDP-4-amino-4,6-dideoxygalactose transaminase